MSDLNNDNFIESRYEEYLNMGYSKKEAKRLAEIDFEEAGDAAPEVYKDE